jgi:hypothetical protein
VSRAYAKDEVPEPVWEFAQWLIRYCTQHRVRTRANARLTLDEWLEVSAEARRRGLTVTESQQGRGLDIDYVKQ